MKPKIRKSLLHPNKASKKEIQKLMKQLAKTNNDPNMVLVTGGHSFGFDPVIKASTGSAGGSLAEKVFGGKDPAIAAQCVPAGCTDSAPVTPRRKLMLKPTANMKLTTSLLSNTDDEEDEKEDSCELMELDAPLGHSLTFSYHPSDYIEYSIAIKAATDLCSTFDYFNAHTEVHNLQVGYSIQQACCVRGTSITNIGDNLVSIALSLDNESNRFYVNIHSYDKDSAKEVGRMFRKLCRKGNFYKGKHLQANSFEREPLTFLANPDEQIIYGFEKEYDSIHTNTIKFFGMHALHKICKQRGVLLSGIPGSGKSLIVSQIKRQALVQGVTVVDMSMAAMHQCGAWYDKIEKWLSPCLVVMEDLDIIGVSREMEKAVQPITTDLLNSLSGNRKDKAVIVTLATTNRPEVLDDALTRARRMDQRYPINGLNPEFKKQLLAAYLEPYKVKLSPDLSNQAINNLGEETTGADISSIAVSTLIHINEGHLPDDAFNLSLDEWQSAHKKKSSTGFIS